MAPVRMYVKLFMGHNTSVIEEDPTRLGELNAASASGHELGADLVLKIPDLTT